MLCAAGLSTALNADAQSLEVQRGHRLLWGRRVGGGLFDVERRLSFTRSATTLGLTFLVETELRRSRCGDDGYHVEAAYRPWRDVA